MKLLTILSLIIFISCEQSEKEVVEESKSGTQKSKPFTNDISHEYYGTYESECIHSGVHMEFGGAYKYQVEFSASGADITLVEYNANPCTQELARRTYQGDFEAEGKNVESVYEVEVEVEFINSELEILHAAWDGYDECGFAADVDTNYVLTSSCDVNWNDSTAKYAIEENADGSYKFTRRSGVSEEFTLTEI